MQYHENADLITDEKPTPSQQKPTMIIVDQDQQ